MTLTWCFKRLRVVEYFFPPLSFRNPDPKGLFLQIRSHAQKYFLKVQKNGTSEHVPPPRPKRKAAHPYPQKASKNGLDCSIWELLYFIFSFAYGIQFDGKNFAASLFPQPATAFQASSCLLEPGYAPRADSSSVLRNSNTNGTMSSWAHSSAHPRIAHMTKGLEFHGHFFRNKVHYFCTSFPNFKNGKLDIMLMYFFVQKI